jgi:hypothetical protein
MAPLFFWRFPALTPPQRSPHALRSAPKPPLSLPQELYYRHLYARTAPSLRARCESWDNYMDLFGVILHNNVNMQLPIAWLWDMVDEFVYQYQVGEAAETQLDSTRAETRAGE